MKKVWIILIAISLAAGTYFTWWFYDSVFRSHLNVDDDAVDLFIPTGAEYADVIRIMEERKLLDDMEDFDWVAQQMNYPRHIKPGRYKLRSNLSNRDLIKLLRSGEQTPVKLLLKKFRTKEEIAGYVSSQLEVDSAGLLSILNDEHFLSAYGLNTDNVMSIFLPNTYHLYWNTTAKKFFVRMNDEFNRYWDSDRRAKALEKGLFPIEAVTLASIVEEESYMKDERPAIAGVYLNRLNRSMKLQADPTVKFAVGNFELRRILKKHTRIESPYNTYHVNGLPPGPICTPSLNSIEAVLNASEHNYLYFCAKDDFSGYHAFASTYRDHMSNARKFQRALNQNGIK